MKEFDFYFLPHEVGALQDLVVPPTTIVVCKEAPDSERLTLFNFNQALQYGSFGALYLQSDLPLIRTKTMRRSDGSAFYVVDDLAEPDHIGLFAHRSISPSMPRVSLSLCPSWKAMSDLYGAIRQSIRSRCISVTHRGLATFVSIPGAEALAKGDATTGDKELDQLVMNQKR